MSRANAKATWFGLAGLATLLVAIVGYLYGHKLLAAADLAGTLAALWQLFSAVLLVCIAGGIGHRVLKDVDLGGLVGFGLAASLGLVILGIAILALGALVGTSLPAFAIPAVILIVLLYKDILAWLRALLELRSAFTGGYQIAVVFGVLFVLGVNLLYALAPPTGYDALVYHLSIPRAYLAQGRITFLPDTMFWGMPQLTEMLFLPVIRIGGVQAATVLGLVIGIVTIIGLFGYVRSKFGETGAWTAVAALVVGDNLARSLSSGYVDWTSMLFGWSAMASLASWLETRDRRMLLLSGAFCGAALGTKYSAGVVLIGCVLVLALLQRDFPWKRVVASILMLSVAAIVASSPWWIKNFIGTGNPFYPFFIAAGSMDQLRLDFVQDVPVWRDWQAVILLPWQATFWGMDGQEGFSASIGPLLVGLSPLAWLGWGARSTSQKQAILTACVITVTGFILWAVGSRVSGLLLQTRLYFAFFPAWAVLAGAGMDAIWNLQVPGIRFGRLLGALVLLIFALELFSLQKSLISQSPASYILRLEDERSYLTRNLGTYELAMQAVRSLPDHSRVLMLWEARGYYCAPICDSDEIIDRWHHDSTLYGNPQAIVQAWHNQGYTHLLIHNSGMEFIREFDIPEEQTMHWSLLDSTLASMVIENRIAGGAYTLYQIP